MPNFNDAVCITEDDVQEILIKITSEESRDQLRPWVQAITHLTNFAYKEGLETGYEIAEAEIYSSDSMKEIN